MERKLGKAHRWLGLAMVLVFFSTGLVMRMHHLDQLGDDSGLRMLFRSRHIYLLFSALLNIVVGLRFVLPAEGRGGRIALAGSLLLLLTPLLLAIAFFAEPLISLQPGPFSIFGVYAAVAGVLFYSLGTWHLSQPPKA